MAKIIFQGDVHGEWNKLAHARKIDADATVIQLGDLGLGFPKENAKTVEYFINSPRNFKFIRGNHDNPEACYRSPNYLGDYGSLGELFYVSGGFSIDREYRIPGIDWWEDEQLSRDDRLKALELYKTRKPEVVISHEAPAFITPEYSPSHTAALLDTMYEAHAPRLWVFGHHHRSFDFVFIHTRFVGLDIDECFTAEVCI